MANGNKAIEEEEFQMAALNFDKLLTLQPENIDAINILGFIHFKMLNYRKSMEYNQQVLDISPNNAYAHKGMGLCYQKLGEKDEAENYLKKSILLADTGFLDPYYDLGVVFLENDKPIEALEILNKGRNISDTFTKRSEELYLQAHKKAKSVKIDQ
jgi:tetratricopeptide (TPR) repeat protein